MKPAQKGNIQKHRQFPIDFASKSFIIKGNQIFFQLQSSLQ